MYEVMQVCVCAYMLERCMMYACMFGCILLYKRLLLDEMYLAPPLLQNTGGAGSTCSLGEEYIRSKAVIYGRDPTKKITKYHQEVNKTAVELALRDPDLLLSKQKLISVARSKVNEHYDFKKRKSRSKQSQSQDSGLASKQSKTSESFRMKHIGELEEDIKDLSDQLRYKGKRREEAEISRNYALCEVLTKEISLLKKEKRKHEQELCLWKRKQQQGDWYKQKKATHSAKDCLSLFSTSDSESEGRQQSSTPAPSTPQSLRTTSPCQSSTPVSPAMYNLNLGQVLSPFFILCTQQAFIPLR